MIPLSRYKNVSGIQYEPTKGKAKDLRRFKANWEKNRDRYEIVAKITNVPAALIAALHWREAGGYRNPDMWGRYLHQGDPLGKKAVHAPKNIPIFHEWEPAAVHAIQYEFRQKPDLEDLKLTKDTTDLAKLCVFAEEFNGAGYYRRGVPSPYVVSATTNYKRGKYVDDGVYSAWAVDQQPGVLPMLWICFGTLTEP